MMLFPIKSMWLYPGPRIQNSPLSRQTNHVHHSWRGAVIELPASWSVDALAPVRN